MKKLAVLFVILALTLAGIACLAETVPAVTNCAVDEAGNITAEITGEGIRSVHVFFEIPDGEWAGSADLTLDEETGKYTGNNPDYPMYPEGKIAQYTIRADYREDEKAGTEQYTDYVLDGNAALKNYEKHSILDRTEESGDGKTRIRTLTLSREAYNASQVKTLEETGTTITVSEWTEYTYTEDGTEQKAAEWRETSETETATRQEYNPETGKAILEAAMREAYTVQENRRTETGTSETKTYEADGRYTGKETSERTATREKGPADGSDSEAWRIVSAERTDRTWNRDDIATEETVTRDANTYTEEKRTFRTTAETTSRNDYGNVIATGAREEVTEEKYDAEKKEFIRDSVSAKETKHNKKGQLIYSKTRMESGGEISGEEAAYDAFGKLTYRRVSREGEKTSHRENYNVHGLWEAEDTEYDGDGNEVQEKTTRYGNLRDGRNTLSLISTRKPEYIRDAEGQIIRRLDNYTRESFDKAGMATETLTHAETYSEKDGTITSTETIVNYVGKPVNAEMKDKTEKVSVRSTDSAKHGDYETTTTVYGWDGSVQTITKESRKTTEETDGRLTVTVSEGTFGADGQTRIEGSTVTTGTDKDGYRFTRSSKTRADGSTETYEQAYNKEKQQTESVRTTRDGKGKLTGRTETREIPTQGKDGEGETFTYTVTETRGYNGAEKLIRDYRDDPYGSSYEKRYTDTGTLTYDYQRDEKGAETTAWYDNPGYTLAKVTRTAPDVVNDKGQITGETLEDTAWYSLDGKQDRRDVTTRAYAYDGDGNMTRRTTVTEYRDGSDKAAVTVTEVYDPENINNCASETKTAGGNVIGYTKRSGYTYDADGTLRGGTTETAVPDYNPYTGEVYATTTEKTETAGDGTVSFTSRTVRGGEVTREETRKTDRDGNRQETVRAYAENEDDGHNYLNGSSESAYDAKTGTTRSSGKAYRPSGAVRSSWESESVYDKDRDLTVTTEKHYNSKGHLAYTVESTEDDIAFAYSDGSTGRNRVANRVYRDAEGREIGYETTDGEGNYAAKIPEEATYSGNVSGAWTELTESWDRLTRSDKQYDRNGRLTYESRTTADSDNSTEYWPWSYEAKKQYASAEDGSGMVRTEEACYNENGSQRYRIVTEEGRVSGTHFRTARETVYGSGGQVVYTYDYTRDLQKGEETGVYRDAAGKEIGHDRRENGDGSWSELYPSDIHVRTGEILEFTEQGEDKDGRAYGITYDGKMNVRERWQETEDSDGRAAENHYEGNRLTKTIYDDGTVYWGSQGGRIRSEAYSASGINSIAHSRRTDYYNQRSERTYSLVGRVTLAENNLQPMDIYLDASGNMIGYRKSETDYKMPVTTYANNITGYTEYIVDEQKGETFSRRYDRNNRQTGERYTRTLTEVTDDKVTQITADRKGNVIVRDVDYRDRDNETVKETTTVYSRWDGRFKEETRTYYDADSRYTARKHIDRHGNVNWYGWVWDENDYLYTQDYWVNGQLQVYSQEERLDEDGVYHYEAYHPDGTHYRQEEHDGNGHIQVWQYDSAGRLREYSETADGVTNITRFNRDGSVSGYDWGITNTERWYLSQDSVVWDANRALYRKHVEEDPDNPGVITTWTDYSGNIKVTNSQGTAVTLHDLSEGWHQAFGNEWYYMEGGRLAKGWRYLGSTWYYFDDSGRMATGKVKDGSAIYATNAFGAWTSSGWNYDAEGNWQYVDKTGKVVTGWQEINGTWYYFDEGWYLNEDAEYDDDLGWVAYNGGNMATGAVKIWVDNWSDLRTYFFRNDGSWDTTPGWKSDGVDWFYFFKGGERAVGWKKISGIWYYFDAMGVMRNGWIPGSGNTWYYLKDDGSMAENEWIRERFEDDWYYLGRGGAMLTGWRKIQGLWYYLEDSGRMAVSEWVRRGNAWYYMTESGAMATGWVKDDGKWYYMNADGTMATGWVLDGGTWYYLNEDGSMATGWLYAGGVWYYLRADGGMVTGQVNIDGRVSRFDASGAWQGYVN